MAQLTLTKTRTGRPPVLQLAIVRLLKVHPEFEFHNVGIARALQGQPAFTNVTPKAIKDAKSKLHKRFNVPASSRLPLEHVCECLGKIASYERELVCTSCGRSYGFRTVATNHDQAEWKNPLWRRYDDSQGLSLKVPLGDGSTRLRNISDAAQHLDQYPDDVLGRLQRRAESVLLQLCKGHAEFSQIVTAEIWGLLVQECKVRSSTLKGRQTEADAKDVVTLALLRYKAQHPESDRTISAMIAESHRFVLTSEKGNKGDKLPTPLEMREMDETAERYDMLETHA